MAFVTLSTILEELIFGNEQITQGAGSDFQQATSKARMMVCTNNSIVLDYGDLMLSYCFAGNKIGNE